MTLFRRVRFTNWHYNRSQKLGVFLDDQDSNVPTSKMVRIPLPIQPHNSFPPWTSWYQTGVIPLENFLWKCNMGYTLYPWILLLESTLETDYQCWYSRTQRLKDTFEMQYNFNLEWTWTNMIPRWQIKSLSMANDPITIGLSQEADTL